MAISLEKINWIGFFKNGTDFIDYARPWRLGRSCGALRALLERSWGCLGSSWDPLGTPLGALATLLGRLGALLGPSWRHLGASWRHLQKDIEKKSRVTLFWGLDWDPKWKPKSLKIHLKNAVEKNIVLEYVSCEIFLNGGLEVQWFFNKFATCSTTKLQDIKKAPTCVSYRILRYETHVHHGSWRSHTCQKTAKINQKWNLEKRAPVKTKNLVFNSILASFSVAKNTEIQ